MALVQIYKLHRPMIVAAQAAKLVRKKIRKGALSADIARHQLAARVCETRGSIIFGIPFGGSLAGFCCGCLMSTSIVASLPIPYVSCNNIWHPTILSVLRLLLLLEILLLLLPILLLFLLPLLPPSGVWQASFRRQQSPHRTLAAQQHQHQCNL